MTTLVMRQWAGLPWLPHSCVPPSPGSGTMGRPARGSRQIGMKFSLLPQVMPQCEPSRGCSPDDPRGYVLHNHTLVLLGCLAELL